MSKGATLTFQIYRDGQLIRTETLSQNIIKIGKLQSSHLRLDDANVSRIHAVIEQSQDGGYHIIDLGSAKGTFLGGEKVNKAELTSGAELTLGDTRIVVTLGDEAPAAASGPAAAGPAAMINDADVPTTIEDAPTDADTTVQVPSPATPAPAPAPAAAAAPAPAAAPTPAPAAAPAPAPTPAPAPAADAAPPAGMDSILAAATAMASERAAAQQPAQQGYYDEAGNYHDGSGGYYDPSGTYHDAQGGYYDAEGNYHDGSGGYYDPSGMYHWYEDPKVSDVEMYQQIYVESAHDSGGAGCLEVALLWRDSLLQVQQFPTKVRQITIGEGKKNTFPVKHDSVPDASFPLVSNEGGDLVLNYTSAMKGFAFIDKEKFDLSQAVQSGRARQGGYGTGSFALPLTPRTRVRVDIGEMTFLIHYADPEKGVPIGGLPIDFSLVGFTLVSLALHTIFMFLAFTLPPQTSEFELDGFDLDNRFVSQIIKPEEEQEEEDPDWLKKNDPGEEGAKAKEEEGKAGKEDSKQKDKAMAVKGPETNKEIKLAKDKEVAYNTGALSVLSDNQLTASFGTGVVTQGFDPVTSMGDMNGTQFGDAYGFGAFGRTGFGRGGGGVSDRSFGTGSFGTAGRGGGGGGGTGYGRNAGTLDDRATRVPKVIPGRPVVTGSLDKELIRRVIRRHRREIKYCYEQELIKNKSLAGKVIVQFTISSTGSVAAAVVKSTTLGSPKVERCITGKVRRWVFPEPKGGGIVIVKYPFVFSPQ